MKIFCIGRNYVDHAKELNNPVPKQPLIFSKFPTALLRRNKPFFIPHFSNNIHYEVELVLKVSKNGKVISKQFASDYYNEIAIGIDFTARDLQSELKSKGHSWEKAKAFDNSAPISSFIPIKDLKNPDNISFYLNKNGERVQSGLSQDMIFDFDELIVQISKYFTVQRGDLIYTGTPAGVGPISIGEKYTAGIEDREMLRCEIK